MNLIIVESPTKAKTISKFLGSKYRVLSSYGHVRDLPKNRLGIDIKNNFKPEYVIPMKSRKNISFLKKEVKKSQSLILATDEDREGEAIAWHLVQILQQSKNLKPYTRIVFHEITKQAIEEALKNPRDININLVNAQQARRILDRFVGYKLSPFLWKKIAKRLSAGRVQSVAVRLICEREKEIEKFIPQEYWKITAELSQNLQKLNIPKFEASLIKINEKILDKLEIKNKEQADKIIKKLKKAEYKVIKIEKKEMKRNPFPPFITSTLQQTAWQKFHWSSKFTMNISQQLYEQGFITYHRTDSLNLSDSSLLAVKKFIVQNYGENYYQFRKYKTKSKIAQEAHEAIRPTFVENYMSLKKNLNDTQFKLYDLIWRRFVACQMTYANFDSTVIEIEALNYIFQTSGQTLKFDGFLKIYPIKYEEIELPLLKINEILKLIKLSKSQHFTQPPSRYNEASLIKTLEKNGIGRPSTYAPILSTIQERNYVEKDENKKFRPTEIGTIVNNILTNHFQEIVDIQFTANMEDDLDKISRGKKEWLSVIKEFYNSFEEKLQKKDKEVLKQNLTEKTEKICPECKSNLLIRFGKFGKFYGCSRFPKCKYAESLENNNLDIPCPKCENGKLIIKRTKKKKIFYGCDKYPNCDFALWDEPLKEKCQKCNSLLIKTKKKQIKCSNKNCLKNNN